MRRTEAWLLAAAMCAGLVACTQADKAATAPDPQSDTATAQSNKNTASVMQVPAPAVVDVEEGSPASSAARQVVVDYYAAIDARDYAKAYAFWSDSGAASGQTFGQFSGGYANTESVRAVVAEATDEEGAAGSRYINVPVELTARQADGSQRRYRGRFTLRAVVADGASEEQRRWHLASAEMQRIAE